MSSTSQPESIGRLAIVLHTHMPYVEGYGTWPFGEEWLWRATAESYLRVADVVEGQPVTLGVTPVLADQFESMRGPAGDRMLDFFATSREYVFGEDMRSFYDVGRGELTSALEPQLADYRVAGECFAGDLDRDLIGLIDRLGSSGVELLGGPATHCVLPLLATDFGARLQLATGLAAHQRRFGRAAGIWLPECAFDDGVDEALAEQGVEYFCVDQSRVHGLNAPENLEPVATPAGPTAVPIDWQTIKLVWHDDGYPVAGAYRSTFERTIHGLLPYNNDGDAWNADAARAQAHAHAASFLRSVAGRLESYEAERGRSGLCVFAIDTELLGHWWYEGPMWLEEVIAHAAASGIELVTLGQGVGGSSPESRPLARSSWGENKTLETWDSPPVASIAWRQRAAELAFADLITRKGRVGSTDQAVEAARELLAMQSSDWAFISNRETAGEYAAQRFRDHATEFDRALTAATGSLPQSGAVSSDQDPILRPAALAPDLTTVALEALASDPR